MAFEDVDGSPAQINLLHPDTFLSVVMLQSQEYFGQSQTFAATVEMHGSHILGGTFSDQVRQVVVRVVQRNYLHAFLTACFIKRNEAGCISI